MIINLGPILFHLYLSPGPPTAEIILKQILVINAFWSQSQAYYYLIRIYLLKDNLKT